MDDKLRRVLNSNKYRNTKIVRVKENRLCNCCDKVIPYDTECLSTNVRYKGRKWFCLRCVELKWEIAKVRAEKDGLPFGDEGGWLALNDYEAELMAELYN